MSSDGTAWPMEGIAHDMQMLEPGEVQEWRVCIKLGGWSETKQILK